MKLWSARLLAFWTENINAAAFWANHAKHFGSALWYFHQIFSSFKEPFFRFSLLVTFLNYRNSIIGKFFFIAGLARRQSKFSTGNNFFYPIYYVLNSSIWIECEIGNFDGLRANKSLINSKKTLNFSKISFSSRKDGHQIYVVGCGTLYVRCDEYPLFAKSRRLPFSVFSDILIFI